MYDLTNLIPRNGRLFTLRPATTIGVAAAGVLSPVVTGLQGARYLGFEAIFLYGAGGTTVKAWIQTSFDGGTTWFDVANVAFTTAALKKVGAVSSSIVAAAPATPTDATLADNTINNGLLGDRIRLKTTSTGDYTGATSLAVYCIAKG